MNTMVHRANERGFANRGWLKTIHSFSFAVYFNPIKMGYGALRVLNDDTVEGGMGFESHSHNNMEIISIPILGSLVHKDSENNERIIHNNEVQIMSAGTGIIHSEHNASKTAKVNFLQIWILPRQKNIEPRYEQKIFYEEEREGQWQIKVSPDTTTGGLWINQDAAISRISIRKNNPVQYQSKFEKSGFYLFLIESDIKVKDLRLTRRDGLGISQINQIGINPNMQSYILLIELPLNV